MRVRALKTAYFKHARLASRDQVEIVLQHHKSILVVEDDEDLRESLRENLEDEGFEVLTATQGEEALELLTSRDRPGLILLDMMMPIMDGKELLSRLRKDPDLRRIPVVGTSALSTAARPAGMRAFLRKPFGLARLLETLEEYVDRLSACGQPGNASC